MATLTLTISGTAPTQQGTIQSSDFGSGAGDEFIIYQDAVAAQTAHMGVAGVGTWYHGAYSTSTNLVGPYDTANQNGGLWTWDNNSENQTAASTVFAVPSGYPAAGTAGQAFVVLQSQGGSYNNFWGAWANGVHISTKKASANTVVYIGTNILSAAGTATGDSSDVRGIMSGAHLGLAVASASAAAPLNVAFTPGSYTDSVAYTYIFTGQVTVTGGTPYSTLLLLNGYDNALTTTLRDAIAADYRTHASSGSNSLTVTTGSKTASGTDLYGTASVAWTDGYDPQRGAYVIAASSNHVNLGGTAPSAWGIDGATVTVRFSPRYIITSWTDTASTPTVKYGSTALVSGTDFVAYNDTANHILYLCLLSDIGTGGVRASSNISGLAALDITAGGGSSVAGSAALTGTGGLAQSGQIVQHGTPNLGGTGNLGASGVPQITGSATETGTGGLAEAGQIAIQDPASLGGSGALAVAGAGWLMGSSLLSETAGLQAGGQVIQHGAPTLAGDGALAESGQVAQQGQPTLEGSGGLSETGSVQQPSTAALGGEGNLTASGTVEIPGSPALEGTGALGTSGGVVIPGAEGLAGDGALSASGTVEEPGQAALDGVGGLAQSGQVQIPGQEAVEGAGRLSEAGQVAIPGQESLSGAGGLSAAGTVPGTGAAQLAGSGGLAESGQVQQHGAPGLGGTGGIGVAGTPQESGTAGLGGSGGLVESGQVEQPGQPTFAGDAALAEAGTVEIAGQPALGGAGGLSIIGTVPGQGSASMGGDGALAESGTVQVPGAEAMGGAGGLTSSGTAQAGQVAGTVTEEGSGALSEAGLVEIPGTATLGGAGGLSAVATPPPVIGALTAVLRLQQPVAVLQLMQPIALIAGERTMLVVNGSVPPSTPVLLQDSANNNAAVDLTAATAVTGQLYRWQNGVRVAQWGTPRTLTPVVPLTGGEATIPFQTGDFSQAGTCELWITVTYPSGPMTTIQPVIVQVEALP